MLESAIQQRIRLAAAENGLLLWRNNVGACEDTTGRLIRYGLCNDSPQMNKMIKSSDLIGIRPMIITPEWVGHTVGVFCAIECKASGWVFRQSDDRAVAQQRFQELVRQAGGFAGFAPSVEEFKAVARL